MRVLGEQTAQIRPNAFDDAKILTPFDQATILEALTGGIVEKLWIDGELVYETRSQAKH